MSVEIPLGSKAYPGLVALVDDEDAELVAGYSWHPLKGTGNKTFYAWADSRLDREGNPVHGDGVHGVRISMHHLISGLKGVDHKDRNGLNNQRDNLRIATPAQQNINQGIRSDSTSGYKGVCWHNQRDKWMARIGLNGKQKSLGLFDDPADAARAYDEAALEHYGEFAALNFSLERQAV